MGDKINAACAICGEGYHLCLSCKDIMKLNPWKQYTDTPEHYKIFQIIRGLSTGVYSKEEAKSKLQKLDLSDLDSFKDNIKKIIKEIIAYVKEPEKIDEVNNVKVDIVSTFDDSGCYESG